MRIIGIDPGATGAIAVLGDDGTLLNVIDMPTIEEKVGRTLRNRVNPALLAANLPLLRDTHVFLEKVNGMPRDGGGAAFTFGTSYGIVLGVLGALHVRYTLVPPAVWKRCRRGSGGN